uniref:G-protein coupled receptors family 1 profile domain-containing protein n=1 Tax=Ascaris lumbricoides TaxID=6252 RepID=A0A9J2PCK4_ASCLU
MAEPMVPGFMKVRVSLVKKQGFVLFQISMAVNNADLSAKETCNSPWPSCLTLSAAAVTIAFMLIVMLAVAGRKKFRALLSPLICSNLSATAKNDCTKVLKCPNKRKLTFFQGIVLGNLLVVLTVHNDSKLRSQRQNWLIVSLAIADLLVGLLVMPLTMTYEITGIWKLVYLATTSIKGNVLCELWLALDVLFVTASILHICVISLDRYWSVTQPLSYPCKRTPLRISIMIGESISWLLSLLICLPPILGWRPKRLPGECALSTDIGYVLYSALGSFYIPVILLIIVYARIFVVTKRHSRQRLKETERTGKTLCELAASAARNSLSNATVHGAPRSATITVTPKASQDMACNVELNRCCSQRSGQLGNHKKKCLNEKANTNACDATSASTDKRRRLLKAKERQATLLLGLILSAFIISWLPFFKESTSPKTQKLSKHLTDYVKTTANENQNRGNSGINPVIYTVFNREFKCALCRQLKRQRKYLASIMERLI